MFVALWTLPAFAHPSSPSGAADPPPVDMLSAQLVASYLLVQLGQFLKRSPLIPWFKCGAPTANRVMAAVFAAVQTVGIGATFDTTAGTLVITGLTLTSIMPAAIEFGRAYITQKVLWVLAFKHDDAPVVIQSVEVHP